MTDTTTNTPDLDIPAELLRRETNDKGITLSAGVEPAVTKVPMGVTAKKLAKAAAKAIKAATAPKEAKPAKAERVAGSKPKARKEAKATPASTPVTPAPALDADGKPLEKVRRSIVPMKFKERYAKTGGTCGDDMALELKAATTTRNADKRECLDVEALWAIAKANQIDVSKYVDLNAGQKRMNVGNKLRGRLAAGEDVVVGTRTFKAEDWQPRA